jgi:hypothetical protein
MRDPPYSPEEKMPLDIPYFLVSSQKGAQVLESKMGTFCFGLETAFG